MSYIQYRQEVKYVPEEADRSSENSSGEMTVFLWFWRRFFAIRSNRRLCF